MFCVKRREHAVLEHLLRHVLEHEFAHHERRVALDQRARGGGAVVVGLDFERQPLQAEMLILQGVREFVREDDAVLRVVERGVLIHEELVLMLVVKRGDLLAEEIDVFFAQRIARRQQPDRRHGRRSCGGIPPRRRPRRVCPTMVCLISLRLSTL